MSTGDADRAGAGSGADRASGGGDFEPGLEPAFDPRFEHDAERDAWLSEALRHAPDADVSAPAALRLSILREARSAAAAPLALPLATTPAPPRASWWQRITAGGAMLWSALARPPVAAGFASAMVATLVGLLWWDRPMDEALPRPPLRSEAPRVREASPAESVTTMRAPLPAPAVDSATANEPSTKERRRDTPDTLARKSAPVSPTSESKTAEHEGRAPLTEWRNDADAMMEPPPGAPPRPIPKPLQDMQPAPAAPPAPEATAAPKARAAAPAAALAPSSDRAELSSRASGMVPPSLPPADNFALAGSPLSSNLAGGGNPVTSVTRSLMTQPGRWTWQLAAGGAAPQAMNDALLGWLIRLDDDTAGAHILRSRSAPASSAGGPVAASPTMVLRLFRDGQPGATLELNADHIAIDTTPTVTRSAAPYEQRIPLPPARIDALKSSLAAATR